jgi:hypothetical protein
VLVCYRKCRASYTELYDKRVEQVRCVRRRTSRLWYRAELTGDWSYRYTDGAGPPDVETHSWVFTSTHAALLFRQCTPTGDDVTREELGVPDGGAIDCGRVARAVGAPLFEDASFAFDGIVSGGDYKLRTSNGTPAGCIGEDYEEHKGSARSAAPRSSA